MGYRIMIADDEPKIIQLIKQLGHWEELGIEIIDECGNGEMALHSILEHEPDFVLSDIKMPGCDGIELIERVRKENSEVLFVLLSGFRHFEYARKAIQLNVIDYLLKPVDEEQLNETLAKLCRRVDQIKAQKQDVAALESIRSLQKRNQMMQFWELLVDRWELLPDVSFLTVESCNERYHTRFTRDCYQVISCVTNLSNMLEYQDSLFSDKMAGFIDQAFEGLGVVYFKADFKGHLIVVNFPEEKKKAVRDAVSVLYYNMRDLNEIYGDFRINIGYSEVKTELRELRNAFVEAVAAEWGRLVLLHDGILEYARLSSLKRYDAAEIIKADEQEKIKECVKYLRKEEMGDLFAVIYKRCTGMAQGHPQDMWNVYLRLLTCVWDGIEDQEEMSRVRTDCHYAYLEARNFTQVIKNMFLELEKYIKEEEQKMKEKLGKPIAEAVAFINQNYSSSVSLEEAAEAGNVSATYLSKLFKEEMNMGFLEYLTQIRIEESQKLLADTNLSIKEIAGAVGYVDEKHYSKVFKKSTGIRPSEYRRLYG